MVLAGLMSVGAASACGSASTGSVNSTGPASQTSTTASSGKTRLTFRAVLQQLGPTGPAPSAPVGGAVLPGRDSHGAVTARYVLGPVLLDGTIIRSAQAHFQPITGQWMVFFVTTADGSVKFDQLAEAYYHRLIAIVLDGDVVSAPEINATSFHGTGQITGDFTEQQAKELAALLS